MRLLSYHIGPFCDALITMPIIKPLSPLAMMPMPLESIGKLANVKPPQFLGGVFAS
jgi:hypothetical protein